MLRRLHSFAAMTVFLAWLLLPAVAQDTGHVNVRDDFSPGTLSHLDMPFPEDWQILSEGNLHYLHMLRPRPPGVPRRPLQFARLKGVSVGSFTLNLKIRREHGSMIVVFGYVDTLHFYYAHLSKDPGAKVSVHNGVFIVDGGERRRIAGVSAQPAIAGPFLARCAHRAGRGLRLHPGLRRPTGTAFVFRCRPDISVRADRARLLR